MFHLVDIQLFTKAFRSFNVLTGLDFSLYDDRENMLIAPSREDAVLSGLKMSRKGQESHGAFFGEYLKLALKKTKTFIVQGPTRQFHVFIPVRYKDVTVIVAAEAFYLSAEDFVRFYDERGAEFGFTERPRESWLKETLVLPHESVERYIEALHPLLENLLASGYEKGELSKQWQWSKTAINLAANIKPSTSLPEIMQMIVDTVLFLYGVDTATIFSLRNGSFEVETSGGRNKGLLAGLSMPRDNEFVAQVLATNAVVSAVDGYRLWRSGLPGEIISMYLFPISSEIGLCGLLGIFNTLLDREAMSSIKEICRITAYFCGVRNVAEEYEKRSDWLRLLSEKATVLYEHYRDPQLLHSRIVNEAAGMIGAEKCSLMLPEENSDMLAIRAVKGTTKWLMEDIRVRAGEGIAGKAFETGEPILIDTEEKLKGFSVTPKPMFKTASCLSVPLKVADETVGILNLSDKSSGEPFTERDLSVLAPFAVQASMLLKLSSLYSASERMRELSITDSLTGLFNRRYFDARIDEEFQRAKRYGLFFSLAIMDIDDFKVLNDTEGHMAGDQVLKEIAQVMSGTIRSNDILVRFGGEEFAIIMPQTSKEESFNVVERIRKSVYSLMFQAFKKLPGRRLTISAGIAMYPDGGDSIESLIVNADRALYQAKSQGKNRSIIWDRGEPSANVQTARGKKK